MVGRATSKFVLASRVIDLILDLDVHEQRVATGDALQRLKKDKQLVIHRQAANTKKKRYCLVEGSPPRGNSRTRLTTVLICCLLDERTLRSVGC